MMTEYNKLVDHLVSTMPSNSMRELTPKERKSLEDVNNEINASSAYNDGWTSADYKEQSNKQERKSFDELYEEYSALSLEDQVTNLKQLGRQLVTTIDRLLDTLNVLLEEEIDESERLHKGTKKGLD